MTALLCKLKDSVQAEAAISDADWITCILKPFILGDGVTLEDELHSEVRDTNPVFKITDITAINELLKKHAAASNADTAVAGTVKVTAGRLEEAEFSLARGPAVTELRIMLFPRISPNPSKFLNCEA